MSAWQLTMMDLGSVIGGAFFLGLSVAINAAGPAILISYILGGVLNNSEKDKSYKNSVTEIKSI